MLNDRASTVKKQALLNATVNNILTGNNERTRAGDDYPARDYVVFSDGIIFWRTRALSIMSGPIVSPSTVAGLTHSLPTQE